MKFTKLQIRSVRGQLTIFGIVYAGSLVLAIVSVFLRGVFFERFAREKYGPLPDRLQPVFESLATDQPPTEALDAKDLDLLYGAWIEDPELDGSEIFAKNLFSIRGEYTLQRLRRTLVAGNPRQRRRAMTFLTFAEHPSLRSGSRQLWQYALLRAQQRGETELSAQARLGLEACEKVSH